MMKKSMGMFSHQGTTRFGRKVVETVHDPDGQNTKSLYSETAYVAGRHIVEGPNERILYIDDVPACLFSCSTIKVDFREGQPTKAK